jgi:hypothetical protein
MPIWVVDLSVSKLSGLSDSGRWLRAVRVSMALN